MSLTADEQDLFDEGRAILPHWFHSNERANEELGEMAKLLGASLSQVVDWLTRQVLITLADGPTSTTPDWLGQHAIDRGTRRQDGELDGVLRDRIRLGDDGICRPVLLAAVNAMLLGFSISGTADMVELPRDEIFFGNVSADTGAHGVFSGPVSGIMTFTPTVKFKMPPYKRPTSTFDVNGESSGPLTAVNGRVRSFQITFSGSTSGGNNGTFATTGVTGQSVKYANGSGVAGADATVLWATKRKNWQSIVADGFRHSFLSRGERIGRLGSEIIVILPYDGTKTDDQLEAARKAVAEMLRTRKGAGVSLRVERREHP